METYSTIQEELTYITKEFSYATQTMIMKPNLTLAGYVLSDFDGNIKSVP
jgi:hypothetical protein